MYLQDGNVVMTSGKVATSAECCCAAGSCLRVFPFASIVPDAASVAAVQAALEDMGYDSIVYIVNPGGLPGSANVTAWFEAECCAIDNNDFVVVTAEGEPLMPGPGAGTQEAVTIRRCVGQQPP